MQGTQDYVCICWRESNQSLGVSWLVSLQTACLKPPAPFPGGSLGTEHCAEGLLGLESTPCHLPGQQKPCPSHCTEGHIKAYRISKMPKSYSCQATARRPGVSCALCPLTALTTFLLVKPPSPTFCLLKTSPKGQDKCPFQTACSSRC